MPVREPQRIGRVAEIWRYPVKSMGGERLDAARAVVRGLEADRGLAVADAQGRLGSGKSTGRFRRMPELIGCSARLHGPDVEVALPDGARHAAGPALDEALSALAGAPVRLVREDGAGHHDAAPLHLLTRASLAAVERALGPGAGDPRRYRPNLVIETAQEGFPEDAWCGRTLAVGECLLPIVEPTERCVMTTVAQDGLAAAPIVLRALAAERGARLGVYASVLSGGVIRVGDPVELR